MNLKEAFRYQNKLQALMDEAQSLLGRDSNVTKVQNTYLRKKVMAEAENETTVDAPPLNTPSRSLMWSDFCCISLISMRRLPRASAPPRTVFPSIWTARSA